MNFLLVDFFSAKNRGDAAILEGMTCTIRHIDPLAEIVVLSYDPDSLRHFPGIIAEKVLLANTSGARGKLKALVLGIAGWRAGRRRKAGRLPDDWKRAMKRYFWADVVLSVGGSNLTDHYAKELEGRFFGLWIAKLLQKKVMIYAQSIGPFRRRLYRGLARYVLNRVDAITVREDISRQILREIGVEKPLVEVTADAAFGLDVSMSDGERETLRRKLAFETVELGGPDWVSISVRRPFLYADSGERYLNQQAEFIDWLVESRKLKVLLLSTRLGSGQSAEDDDRWMAARLLERLRYTGKVRLLREEYSPKELAAIYGRMRIHVGLRMHSCILALLGKTPVLPIRYEHKTDGIFSMMGMADLVVPYEEATADRLQGVFARIDADYVNVRRLVEGGVDRMRAREKGNRLVLQNLLAGRAT